MKKRIIIGCIIAVVAAINVTMSNKTAALSDLALVNIEALAQQEASKYGYYVWHFNCYDHYGDSTGQATASSSYQENGPRSTSHNHSCSDCTY